MKKILFLFGMMTVLSAQAELVQQFRDPTFSGQGWSSQVLTLEQMRESAKATVDSKAAAAQAAADAAAQNTPLAKFMALFTGQVYSQLATQLTNNLFKDCVSGGGASCTDGTFNVSTTQQIYWQKVGGNVTLNVYSGTTNASGTFTRTNPNTPDQSISVPISSFSF
jgi:hypothetical protein